LGGLKWQSGFKECRNMIAIKQVCYDENVDFCVWGKTMWRNLTFSLMSFPVLFCMLVVYGT
jgi:hypothetical protein